VWKFHCSAHSSVSIPYKLGTFLLTTIKSFMLLYCNGKQNSFLLIENTKPALEWGLFVSTVLHQYMGSLLCRRNLSLMGRTLSRWFGRVYIYRVTLYSYYSRYIIWHCVVFSVTNRHFLKWVTMTFILLFPYSSSPSVAEGQEKCQILMLLE
jgi:hypothetical protein